MYTSLQHILTTPIHSNHTHRFHRLELHSIKAEIAELKRKPTSSFPVEIQCQFGQELKNIREEVSSLQKRFTDLPTVTPIIKFPKTTIRQIPPRVCTLVLFILIYFISINIRND